MVLTRDLQQGRKRLVIRVHLAADLVRNVLVDEHNRDILAFSRERFERGLDRVFFGFRVHDQVVLLAVGRVGYVAYACEEDACY